LRPSGSGLHSHRHLSAAVRPMWCLRRHMALPRSAGLPEVVGGSRPVIHSENNVIFSHVGFARMTNGATAGCPIVADPPRLSAGRAYTWFAACSDALMSHEAARGELPSHPERAASRRSGPWLTSHQATPKHTRVKRAPRRRQSAFDRPDPHLAAERSRRRTNRTNVHDRAPSSHRTAKPAWLGHWAYRHAAITPSTRFACAPRACEKRRLSPNLCSRLIFKCTQGDIAFPGGGSHLLLSIRSPASEPVGSRPFLCKREPIAVPPLPAGTAPNGSAVGAATANRRRNIHLYGRSVSRASSRAAFSTTTGPDASTPDASVSLLCRFRHPGAPTPAQDRPEPRHTKNGTATDRSALPPTSPSSSRQGLRPIQTR